jgi:hypothetical protein
MMRRQSSAKLEEGGSGYRRGRCGSLGDTGLETAAKMMALKFTPFWTDHSQQGL